MLRFIHAADDAPHSACIRAPGPWHAGGVRARTDRLRAERPRRRRCALARHASLGSAPDQQPGRARCQHARGRQRRQRHRRAEQQGGLLLAQPDRHRRRRRRPPVPRQRGLPRAVGLHGADGLRRQPVLARLQRVLQPVHGAGQLQPVPGEPVFRRHHVHAQLRQRQRARHPDQPAAARRAHRLRPLHRRQRQEDEAPG